MPKRLIEQNNGFTIKVATFMKAGELIKFLLKQGISVKLQGDDLNIAAKSGIVSKEILSIIKNHKEMLVAVLRDVKQYTRCQEILPAPQLNWYPLTNSQMRMWVLSQSSEGSVAYNIPFAFRLSGRINYIFLRRAYTLVIERHESLRTAFVLKDGIPAQHIIPIHEYNVTINEKILPRSKQNRTSIKRILEEESKHLHDLEMGQLFRLTFFKESENSCIVSINIHHIISDEASIKIILEDFLYIYNQLENKRLPALPPLAIQFKDYAYNESKKSKAYEKDLMYWKKKLSGELPLISIISENELSDLGYKGAFRHFTMDNDFLNQIKALSIEYETTMFTIIFALVTLFLFKYTTKTDIIIGIPTTDRNHPKLERLVGCFINSLPIRITFDSGDLVSNFINIIKQSVGEAIMHRYCPYDLILQEVSKQNNRRVKTLFDVMILFRGRNEVIDIARELLPELSITPLETYTTASKFPIAFNFEESEQEMLCEIEYNTDAFSIDTIDRIIEHFKSVVSCIFKKPDLPINEIDYLSDQEKKTLLGMGGIFD